MADKRNKTASNDDIFDQLLKEEETIMAEIEKKEAETMEEEEVIEEEEVEEEEHECESCGACYSDEHEASVCCIFTCDFCCEEYTDEDSADECCSHECPNCGDKYSDSYNASDCCPSYECPECGNEFYDEDESAECCSGSSSYGTMGSSTVAPWVARGHDIVKIIEGDKDMKTALAAWDLTDLPNPGEAAADFYLLEIITGDLLTATGGRVATIQPSVIYNMHALFGMDYDDIQNMASPSSPFEELLLRASVYTAKCVEEYDRLFLNYAQMAIGGELRHHIAVGGHVINPPNSRTSAWVGWREVVEDVGPEIFLDSAKLFLEFGNGSFGGKAWATPCEIVHMRLTGNLGPDDYENRKLFVDRVWTLEHNSGCFLNKINWKPGTSLNELKMILNAHAKDNPDLMTLYGFASEQGQQLFSEYAEFVRETDPKKVPEKLKPMKVTGCGYCSIPMGHGHMFTCEWGQIGEDKAVQDGHSVFSSYHLGNIPYELKKKFENPELFGAFYGPNGQIANPKAEIKVVLFGHRKYGEKFEHAFTGPVGDMKSYFENISLEDTPVSDGWMYRANFTLTENGHKTLGLSYDSYGYNEFATALPTQNETIKNMTLNNASDVLSNMLKKVVHS